MADNRQELERIRRVYAARLNRASEKYSCFHPATLLEIQQRERLLLAGLAHEGIRDLSAARILDVGCGRGDMLRRFVGYGAQPEQLHGIDLLSERIVAALALAPNTNLVCGNAAALPYRDASFDIVMQFTALSSVVDPDAKAHIAAEMLRVLRPTGVIIWYDFWLNPTNPDVRGITPAEVRQLFPRCIYRFRRTTLAPPLARRLATHSVLLCHLLERVPFLLSHYLAVIRPSASQWSSLV